MQDDNNLPNLGQLAVVKHTFDGAARKQQTCKLLPRPCKQVDLGIHFGPPITTHAFSNCCNTCTCKPLQAWHKMTKLQFLLATKPTESAPPSSWYLRLLLIPMCSDQQAALPSTLGGSFALTYVGSNCCLQGETNDTQAQQQQHQTMYAVSCAGKRRLIHAACCFQAALACLLLSCLCCNWMTVCASGKACPCA
jgi:hypothetical protein